MDDVLVAELCPSGSPCRIEAAERRGISLAQLIALVGHLCRRGGEQGLLPGWADARTGSPVHLQAANLYHLNQHLILPSTARFRCSFVELVAARAEEQLPEYFCSHWWGEPAVHFVMCLQHFVSVRRPERSVFWICAYANNQHDLQGDVCADPADSSFRRALDISRGTLMVLDSSATPFSRVWCAYEMFTSLRQPEKIFDFVTFVPEAPTAKADGGRACPLPEVRGSSLHCPGAAELITQGFVPGDHEGRGKAVRAGHVTRPGAEPAEMKAVREASFPMGIALRAVETEVQSASASVDRDRVHILNAIAGSEILERAPPRAHPSYDEVNGTIRSRFAAAVLANAVRSHTGYVQRLIRAICGDTHRRELDLQLTSSGFSDDMLQELAEALPASIESFGLGLGGTPVRDSGIVALGEALRRLKAMSSFSLYVNGRALTSASSLALATGLGTLTELSMLKLYFTSTQVSDEGVTALARSLAGLPRLTYLQLGFSFTPVSEGGLVPVAEALGGKGNLQHLGLTANNTRAGSEDVVALAGRIPGLTGLKGLWLGFFKTRVDDRGARAAFEAARGLCEHGLAQVFLDFGSSGVSNAGLGQAVKSPDALRQRLAAWEAAGARPDAARAWPEHEAAQERTLRCCPRRRGQPPSLAKP